MKSRDTEAKTFGISNSPELTWWEKHGAHDTVLPDLDAPHSWCHVVPIHLCCGQHLPFVCPTAPAVTLDHMAPHQRQMHGVWSLNVSLTQPADKGEKTTLVFTSERSTHLKSLFCVFSSMAE